MRKIITYNIIWIALIVITFFLCMKYTSFMLELAREDYIIENLTALFYFASSLVFATLLFTFWKKNKRINFLSFCYKYKFYFFFLAFTIFVAGEEISWGQRILKIQTPETLKQINLQNEVNLHNIAGGVFDYNLQYYFIVLFFFINGVFIPLINLYPPIKKLLNKINFPVMDISLIMIFLGATLAIKIWVNVYDGPVVISSEGKSSADLITEYIVELFTGIGFLLYPIFILKHNALQPDQRQ